LGLEEVEIVYRPFWAKRGERMNRESKLGYLFGPCTLKQQLAQCDSPFTNVLDEATKAKSEAEAKEREEARRKEAIKVATLQIAEELVTEHEFTVVKAFEIAKELVAAAQTFMTAD
jgi:tRNA A22 N-methylase